MKVAEQEGGQGGVGGWMEEERRWKII